MAWGGGRAPTFVTAIALLLSVMTRHSGASLSLGTGTIGLGTTGLGSSNLGSLSLGTPSLSSLGSLGLGLTGFGSGTSNISVSVGSLTDSTLLTTIAQVLSGNAAIATSLTSGNFGGIPASLALLAAALKAPIVALYQISAEVVVMVALILFISYIASLLGIDDFRRRIGAVTEGSDSEGIVPNLYRGFISNVVHSDLVQDITDRVYDAVDNFDLKDFLEKLDTRY